MTRSVFSSDNPGSPFLEGLKRYGERRIIRFHTPGHRGGRWLEPSFLEAIGPGAAALDISDLLEGEQGPADWTEAIRQAEQRAAKVFGAAATRFLVNGTSGGIHAAMIAAGGKRAVFSRASHLSVYAAAILADVEVRYLPPTYDLEWDIPGPPSHKGILTALQDFRPSVAVDTYPNYYGLTHDLSTWSVEGRPRAATDAATTEETRATGNARTSGGVTDSEDIPVAKPLPLLIADEAHGSHFAVCPGAPPTALSRGADLTVQSFHKTLGAMTQCSVLHVAKQAPHLVPLVDRSLLFLQTTSPSPILLASLEAAVRQIERSTQIENEWKRAVNIAGDLRASIDRRTGCRCLDEAYARAKWGAALDPARLVINVSGAGWTGIGAARWLRTEKRIQVEMANQVAIVVLVSPGNDVFDAERLVDALQELSRTPSPQRPAVVAPPPWSLQEIPAREALARPVEWIFLDRAAGRIASELVCPYPPGIPVLVPGEKITAEMVEYLRHVRRVGWEVRGAAMWDADKIGVVK